jgi:hypothetical protein
LVKVSQADWDLFSPSSVEGVKGALERVPMAMRIFWFAAVNILGIALLAMPYLTLAN